MDKPTVTMEHLGYSGVKYLLEYFESDSFSHLPKDKVKQSYGIAFHGDRLIIVNNIQKPGSYTPVGGGVDEGEHPDDTLVREIQEESNMKVLSFKPLGYQRVTDMTGSEGAYYQLRYFCIVEPYGPFVSDPAGKVTEMLEIDPKEYKTYFDWGEIGDHIMNRAMKLKVELKKNI